MYVCVCMQIYREGWNSEGEPAGTYIRTQTCVCLCVCVCVFIHACINAYACTYMYVCLLRMYGCSMCVFIFIEKDTHMHIYTQHENIGVNVQLRMCTLLCMYVCMFVVMYVCMYVRCSACMYYVCVYVYIHTVKKRPLSFGWYV
jgi:hypothetical protein